ncbi:MAG: hypothetical protein IJ997_02180 [Mycoplasmataceae bacterium]|nr:hypothetical protein [Mycoplasmataceae bacterium]
MNINNNIFYTYNNNNTIIEFNEPVNEGYNFINNKHLVNIPNIISGTINISGSSSRLGSITLERGEEAYDKCAYLLTACGWARSDTTTSVASKKCSYYIQVGSNRSYCTNGCRNNTRNITFVLYIPSGSDDVTVYLYTETTLSTNTGNLRVQLIPII